MIRLERLSKTFRAGEREFSALEDVSFAVAGGEIVAILGPSGSGKTTLLNIIGGIDRPTSGKAVVGGADISTVCDRELAEYRRRQLGFVFQFYNLVPNLTVEENVEVCANISSAPLPTAEVLASVGMLDKRGKFPAELSGGEQQRTAIAR
jgi:putative ABC transport system ATP-binding protein